MSTFKAELEMDNQAAEGLETLLAQAIRKYPILYEKNHKYHFASSYPDKHRDIWNRISDELNLEVESCQSLWSCIKQKFIKYRKRLDNGDTLNKEWATYEHLKHWLNDHIKKRR